MNPDEIGLWKATLRPVDAVLLDPADHDLPRCQFRSQSERSLATSLLADYAATDAGRLASLVSEADAEQFAALFPILSQHGEEAVSRLESIVDQVPAAKWNDPPLNPSWSAVAVADVRTIEAADGLIGERFAFCQTMPLEQFHRVATNETLAIGHFDFCPVPGGRRRRSSPPFGLETEPTGKLSWDDNGRRP